MNFMPRLIITLLVLALLSRQGMAQTTLYFDTNGSTPGTATSGTGNDSQQVWSTDPTGSSSTETYVEDSEIYFSASNGVNVGTGTQTYTFSDGDTVLDIGDQSGTVTLDGDNGSGITLDGDGVFMQSSAGPLTFDSSLGKLTLVTNPNTGPPGVYFYSAEQVNVNCGLVGTGVFVGTDVSLYVDGSMTGGSPNIVTGGSLNINGIASGSMNLEAAFATLALNNGSNTFTGTVTADTGGTISVGHTGSLNGNTVYLNNGGTFEFTYYEGYGSYNNAIVLGTDGGNIAVKATSGPDDAVYGGTITGGTGLTLTTGDLLETSTDGNNNVGTLNIDAGSRLLAIGGGIFANNATVNVDGGILDFANGFNLANPITLTDGSTIASRGGYTTLSNVTFPTTGTIGLGSDDSGGGAIEITSGINTGTGLTLDINGENNSTNATPVILSGVISGSGPLTLSRGQDLGSFLTINNSNNSYSGATTINNLTVQVYNNSGNAFGSSVVTLNNSTLMVGGNYYNYLNTNEFILGTVTNTIEGGGISSFSGYFVQGAGSELHVEGANNTFVGNSNQSDIGTLDVDGGRLFLVGGNGLNLIANGTVVNVNNITNNPFGAAFLDFATQQTQEVDNAIHFASGTGLQMRGSGTNITLTDAYLPTAGRFVAGSDDTGSTGSYTLTKGVTLTGDLTFDIGDSAGSNVPVTMQGAIGGSGGIIQTDTLYRPGLFILSGANSYSGDTTITSGTMQIASTGSLPTTTAVVEGGSGTSGTLILGDASGSLSATIAGLTSFVGSTGNSVYNGNTGSSAPSSLNVNLASGTNIYAGTIGSNTTNGNNLSLTKSGAGKLVLSGTNTYTGGTTVSGGTLAVNGSIAGNVSVGSGAELGGSGSGGGTMSGAGSVGPGNSPGILTASAVSPGAGTSFNFEFTLSGTPDYGTATASGNDILHLEGGTPFTAALGAGNTINLYFAGVGTYEGGFFVNGSDSLSSAVAGATFNYYIEDASGSVSYNCNNYELTSGSEQTIAAANAAFADGTVSGYTEEFTASAAPEPSTYAMMLGGLALLGFFIRRRQVRA
jgi:fibronectin-binding autotransporter adhesin